MPLLIENDAIPAPPTLEELRTEVGAGTGADIDTALTRCIMEAVELVDKYAEANAMPDVPIPVVIVEAAYMAAATDLWYRRSAPHGIVTSQYDAGMGDVTAPIRISRDPMTAVRPILAQWMMSVGFA